MPKRQNLQLSVKILRQNVNIFCKRVEKKKKIAFFAQGKHTSLTAVSKWL